MIKQIEKNNKILLKKIREINNRIYAIMLDCEVRVFIGTYTYHHIDIVCPNEYYLNAVEKATDTIERAFNTAYKKYLYGGDDVVCKIELSRDSNEIAKNMCVDVVCVECKNEIIELVSCTDKKIECKRCGKTYGLQWEGTKLMFIKFEVN